MARKNTFILEGKGLNRLVEDLKSSASNVSEDIQNIANEAVDEWRQLVIPLTPIDTGQMAFSWRTRHNEPIGGNPSAVLENIAKSEDGKPYPLFVDMGHRVVTRSGEEVGYFVGYHVVEKAYVELERFIAEKVNDTLKSSMRGG